MDENVDVTQIGDQWGRSVHRKCSISRVENGYVVDYTAVREKMPDDELEALAHGKTVSRKRVFTNNADLVEFIESYFKGSPGL